MSTTADEPAPPSAAPPRLPALDPRLPEQLRTLRIAPDDGAALAVSALSQMRQGAPMDDVVVHPPRGAGAAHPDQSDQPQPQSLLQPASDGPSAAAVAETSSASHRESISSPTPHATSVTSMLEEEGVGAHPIVRTTLDVIEQAKAKSRLVKYGADLVGSIGRPVLSKVGDVLGEENVQQLDGFARRQLDWVFPSSLVDPASVTDEEVEAQLAQLLAPGEREALEATVQAQLLSLPPDLPDDERKLRRRTVLLYVLQTRMAPPPKEHPHRSRPYPEPGSSLRQRKGKAVQLLSPGGGAGRVSHVHVHAPADALAATEVGGLSGAMARSPESIKSLKYCLQWLQYATAHMEHHITSLRDLMVEHNQNQAGGAGGADGGGGHVPSHGSAGGEDLSQIRGDVVGTIRRVVEVVSTHAGAALPGPARNAVRGFILGLPARWASAPAATAGEGEPQAASRVFTLAVESLDVLRNVTVVFGESLDRVDGWMEQVRMLSVQRKRALEAGRRSPAPSDVSAASSKRRRTRTLPRSSRHSSVRGAHSHLSDTSPIMGLSPLPDASVQDHP